VAAAESSKHLETAVNLPVRRHHRAKDSWGDWVSAPFPSSSGSTRPWVVEFGDFVTLGGLTFIAARGTFSACVSGSNWRRLAIGRFGNRLKAGSALCLRLRCLFGWIVDFASRDLAVVRLADGPPLDSTSRPAAGFPLLWRWGPR